MKKLGLVVLGLIVIIVVAVIAVPRFIDWNGFKPEIAEAVRDATGRELRIDGDIEVTIWPGLEFSVSGIRLSNAPGAAEPEMVSVAGVSGRIGLFPLIGRSVEIERLVIEQPVAHLEVDAAGRPNWIFETTKTARKDTARKEREQEAAAPERDEGLPISELRLGEVRIERGLVTYSDAVTGQRIEAKDIGVTLGLAGLNSPFTMAGKLNLNGEDVTLDLSLDTPGGLLGGERALAKAALAAPRISAAYDGGLQQKPVPGLDGTFGLDIPSVGQLAAWLGRPLDPAQPDPGPLKVQARFSGDGAKVALEEATIKGDALDAKASGSFDGSGEIMKLALKVESGVLDIDRYLPPPSEAPRATKARADGDRPKQRPGHPLEALPDEPIDLSPLRQAEADVAIDIGGIKAVGFEVGHIAFTTTLKGGVLAADLSEILLYGGKVQGTTVLDASGEALGVDAAFTVDKVDVGALARAATKGEAPVAGIASGSLTAKAQGASPRALAETLA
ncbi:MAG: AsmA family protein, partial [Rhodospirillales bacterium]|nr:AsmA family protein [Rhodospirillales bacterium]